MTITIYGPSGPESLPREELSARLAAGDGLIWVDIVGPTDDGVHLMHDVFHFHPLAIEDTRNFRQRPKVEEYAEYLFVILNAVELDGSHATALREVDVFVGRNYLVTVHAAAEPALAEARQRLERAPASLLSPGYLLYVVVDSVVDGYFPVLDRFEEDIDQLGDAILTHPRPELLSDLFELKTALLDMWRVVWPQREIVNNLLAYNRHVIDLQALQPYLRDVGDHLMWIADMVNTFRDTLTGVMDLYMSAVSNRLNMVVNRLTVFTVLIGILTVIGGFYGMNFAHTFPPFADAWGVPFVLALMAGAAAALLYVFRRLGWF